MRESRRTFSGENQLYFEFVNKVLLPKSKKRTTASIIVMFLMECLHRMDDINIPAIMLEHMRKIIIIKDGKHGICYGYLLT